MSSPDRPSPFCRLCLTKTVDIVPVFNDEQKFDVLLQLIEIQIDQDDEPDAVVCLDCVVTLEGFYQFKEQCHLNDKYVKSITPKLDESSASSTEEEGSQEGFLEDEDYLILSEAEEAIQQLPSRTAECNENQNVRNPKELPASKRAERFVEKIRIQFVSEKKIDSFENKFRQFAAKQMKEVDRQDESTSSINEFIAPLTEGSSEADSDFDSDTQTKRKTNAQYFDAENSSKRKTVNKLEKLESDINTETETPSEEQRDKDVLEDDTNVEEILDLDKIEEECKALKIRKRTQQGPSLDEQLVLADSYPDYFFFEKVPRSVNFILVYYGERFYSAVFTEYYTYWTCKYHRRYDCPAQVRVTNDYKAFERRYEHTHPDVKDRLEGQPFTPMEALPKLFEACRKMVLRYRVKRRKQVLEKHKLLQRGKSKSSTKQRAPNPSSVEEVFVTAHDSNDQEEDGNIEYVEVVEENAPQDNSDATPEVEGVNRSRPKRNIKRNSRYAAKN